MQIFLKFVSKSEKRSAQWDVLGLHNTHFYCAKRPYVRECKIRLTKILFVSFRSSFFVKKVIAFWGGDMEVSSLLVEGGVLTHRFSGSQKLTALIRD